jgi:hypothetical protein
MVQRKYKRSFGRMITWWVAWLAVWLVFSGESPLSFDPHFQLSQLSSGYDFDFISWELNALARKLAYNLLAPQRWMDSETQSRFVLEYMQRVGEAQELEATIQAAYIDPAVKDPELATVEPRAQLAALRGRLNGESPIAEGILQEQGSLMLETVGLAWGGLTLPPMQGTFTPLPYLLVVSPREKIQAYDERLLWPGLETERQEFLERRMETEMPDYSALVTPIGGLAAYPAMLAETNSIDWAAEVMVHEWTHHALIFSPLGWSYLNSYDARTINETTAQVMGEWGGQAIIQRFYRPYLERDKKLPDPLGDAPGRQAEFQGPTFDYWGEMHQTRVTADRLLAQGEIQRAELYLEAQRRYFVAQGYGIRRLNQAYFAFYGAYAGRPGAAGADPIGPAVRRIWALSATPRQFLERMGQVTERVGLLYAVQGLAAHP